MADERDVRNALREFVGEVFQMDRKLRLVPKRKHYHPHTLGVLVDTLAKKHGVEDEDPDDE